MAFAIADRVQETTVTQGTGTVVLAGAVTGYQSFAVVGDTNTTYYTIADQSGSNWEVGIGTYYSGNVSLARTTILASSNSNATVNFGAGTKSVFITYPAEKAIYSDASNITTITNFVSANVLITGGTINNVSISNATYSGLGTMSTQNANAVVITGGTINSTTQNASSYNNVTINAGTINGVTISNATYSGLGTMSTQNANSVTITGGTLNNVVIGGTTPANGSFNNLTVTGPVFANASTGTSGQVLTSGGAGANTFWSTVSGGGGSNVGIGNSSIIVVNTNITANANISSGQNGFSVGPVNTANGVTVTVASGQRWVII